jgi:hypothetical protein
MRSDVYRYFEINSKKKKLTLPRSTPPAFRMWTLRGWAPDGARAGLRLGAVPVHLLPNDMNPVRRGWPVAAVWARERSPLQEFVL